MPFGRRFGAGGGGLTCKAPTRIQTLGPIQGASGNFAAAPTNGNFIVVIAGNRGNQVTEVTETGVTFERFYRYSNNNDVEIWVGRVGAGAATLITVTQGGDTPIFIAVEYSATGAVIVALDQIAYNTASTQNTTTGTTAATFCSNQLWAGAVFASSVNDMTQTNPINGFALIGGTSFGGFARSLGYLEKIVSATGTASSGDTLQNAPVDAWVAIMTTIIFL